MTTILVVNSGSSSVKYQLVDAASGARFASGLVERIGEPLGRIQHQAGEARSERELAVPDHAAGFAAMLDAFAQAGTPISELGVAAVGHRVVQGGSEFVEPTLITDEVAERILALGELAPLHNPAHYQAIVAARAAFPEVPHVAVFDTAFHQSIPAEAYTYAIDTTVAAEHGIRRYGFHGISHLVVSRRAAAFLGKPVSSLKQIVLHLGNGASACAIDGGISVDTSMGLTPLEGLVMGTRSGDLDPGLMLHLLRVGYSTDQLDQLLNKRSGLMGLAGSNDFRDLQRAAEEGDAASQLAFGVYVHAIRRYLGAYLVELGGADTIVFTAGVGENSPALRAAVCAELEWFGVRIDPARNTAVGGGPRRISADHSRIEVLVVPTDEEAEIARQTWQLVSA
ncbi:acetate kinase [Leucobacter viscericola]|uniref:Acetate kinase n=1 Tax=Leucobacter viscericola TaxID=2714935 RepID=A0A6G7XHA4_9MICO|nr:acetate kinase [Leucobacter viscericola]QIK63945.1 acetate kinase [Leucobacter viscericola]